MNNHTILILACTLAQTLRAGPVEDASLLLQQQRYAEAAVKLTDKAISAEKDVGYVHYLRAVAWAESKMHDRAIADCDAVPAGHAWQRKALFLKAQCLAELKRHQEAEAIYSAEATRLFATVRKEKLAESLVTLAQEITKPAVPGQSLSGDAYNKALALYRKALELETGPAVRENLLFQSASIIRRMLRHQEFPAACDAYLREFDPDWRGLTGSEPPKTPAKETGARRWELRAMLIENLLVAGAGDASRVYAEDMLKLWKAKPPAAGTKPDVGELEWLLCRSHGALSSYPVVDPSQVAQMSNGMQQGSFQRMQVQQGTLQLHPVNAGDPVKHVAALRAFLKAYPAHARSAEAAMTLVQVLIGQNKPDEAIEACKALYDRADWPAPAADESDKRTPAERLESWRQMAFFQIGALHFAARRYPQAIEQWRAYIAKHPDGGLWQQAQARIVEAEFQLCLEAVAADNRDEATKRFDAFIATHPLDARCAQLLFLNGQWPYASALKEKDAAKAKPLFEKAIAEWARLIIKHPQSEEASLALYRTGVVQAEHLDRHEDALNTFQRLNWGGWKQLAAERAAMMPERSLALRTPRTFRTNEPAQVRVNVRNIEKLKVSRYTLNLEDFYRSRHRLDGAAGIGSLDIDLIQPDKTWEVAIEGYTRLKPIEQAIDVPFDNAKPGVCLIRVEGEDWQASTIVIRSDIDLIVQSAWKEALVFVQDRAKGVAVADAEVLISNGKEIIGQGKTAKDGVFRLRGEMIREAADLCVHVRTDAGVAIQRLNLRGMTQEITGGGTDRESVALSRRGYIYTDKSAYRAGDAVHFRGIIRDVQDGAYSVPVGREYQISITDDHGRVLRRMKSKLGDFGSFTQSVPLPASTPVGSYRITAKAVDGDESHSAWFEVKEFEIEEISAVIETKPEAVFRGDHIEGSLRVSYSWGSPLADEPVRLRMPDGRLLEGKTDAKGVFTFTQETTAFQPGGFVSFNADLPARSRHVTHTVAILSAGLRLVWDRLPSPALTDEPALVRVKALDHRGKPAAASVKVTLSRLDTQPANPVLSGLPGLVYIPNASAPARIAEFVIETDAATGLGTSTIVLQSAVQHQLHAQTADACGNAVEIKSFIQASGPDDKTRLRLFSDDNEVNEGTALKVDAHSRIAAPLALVTLAGEEMIEHRILKLESGHNELPVAIAAAHWPHFEMSVACLDGDKLHSAHKGFAVKRPLKIEIETPAHPVKPGDTAEITLTTTDANGKPVAAELSLALASAALFAQHPVGTEDIDDFFHGSLRRATSLRISSNAAFEHRAASKFLTRDESGNVIQIAEHMQSHVERVREMEGRERSVWNQQLVRGNRMQVEGFVAQGAFQVPTEFDPPQLNQTLTLGSGAVLVTNGSAVVTTSGANTLNFTGGISGGGWAVNTPTTPTAFATADRYVDLNEPMSRMGRLNDIPIIGRLFQTADGSQEGGKPFAPDAQWHCPLVTDASGKATVRTVVYTAGAWKLTSRGCTVKTHVGATTKELVTKDEFFTSLKTPAALRSGDVFQASASVFGKPKDSSEAAVHLGMRAKFGWEETPQPLLATQESKLALKGEEPATIAFTAITTPAVSGNYYLGMSAEAGNLSAADRGNLQVLESGETIQTHSALVMNASGDKLLPASEAKRATIAVHPSPKALLQRMMPRLEWLIKTTPQTAASRLLSIVSAYETIDEEKHKLAAREYSQRTISELQITQRDGGWTWQDVKWQHDSVVTSLALWALVEAKALGLEVEDATLKAASAYLKKALVIIPPDEPDKAAIILHALACVNEADFSVANRMYRDRAKLNDPALAWLAAAFQRMNRVDEAKELLKALEAKPAWAGSKTTSRLSSDDDTTAIVLYAASKTQAGSPLAKKAAEALMQRLGVDLGAQSALQGLWTAALAEHFNSTGLHQAPEAEEMKLTLNGETRNVGAGEKIQIPTPKPGADGKIHLGLSWKDNKGLLIVLTTFIDEKPVDVKAARVSDLPSVVRRSWFHEDLRHHDVPIDAPGSSPVRIAAHGQRIRVNLELGPPKQIQNGYVIIDEPLPGGCMYVPDSLVGDAARVEQLPGMLRLWFIPRHFSTEVMTDISYDIIALHPGTYRIPHTRVRDACHTTRFNAGPEGKLTILEPGKPSPDPYVMNGYEHLVLAKLLFDEDALDAALPHLEAVRNDAGLKSNERDIARMLLWIHTSREGMDAKQVVELFEALSERHPDIVIPFDRILKVAAAYRQIGEFERAWLVYRATMDSSFVSDAGVSAALETAGDLPGSAEHQTSLWMEYPNGADGLLAFFSLGQRFQEFAANPASVPLRPGAAKWTKNQLLERSRDLLRQLVTLHAKDDLADDAVFSLTNVFFDLKDYASVVTTAGNAAATFKKSSFLNNFHYMTALGRFWQYQFPEALAAAAPVAAGSSEDAPNARYITAQIHHAQGKAAEAIRWYEKVKDEFDDARESISVLQEKGVKLPHATRVKPGQPVKLELDHRNVKEAALLIYRVDLMKLHERQKDLSSVSGVNLSGITPQAEMKVPLGDGLDYAWKKRSIELPLKDEGAYLVICRGDSQMTSGLVLLTTLELETHEDATNGSIRVQLRDTVRSAYVADADIAAYDSSGAAQPQKGRTDPRGAFSASGIHGQATVVVKLGDARYAIHRSAGSLMPATLPGRGQVTPQPANGAPRLQPAAPTVGKPMSKDAYLLNVKGKFDASNSDNKAAWLNKLQTEGKGVKAEKAFKK